MTQFMEAYLQAKLTRDPLEAIIDCAIGQIAALVSRLLAGKTVLVIAHRMRTVEAADKIVLLSEGAVAEEGKPEDLLADESSIFRRMAQLQSASAHWSI